MAFPFLLITCQVGAERALKSELAREWPQFKFAYSRPGFLTFKLPDDLELSLNFNLRSVFARGWAFSLGKADGDSPQQRAAAVRRLAGDRPIQRLHVWPRDTAAPGEHGYEPGLTEDSDAAEAAIRHEFADCATLSARRLARAGELTLDCVLVQPDEWWVGLHAARGWASRRPGGLSRWKLPETAVSRAYLKMIESLAWSRLPTEPDQLWCEIGCAPGGSCQALLDRGLRVMGIDPAAMHPRVLEHANFSHVRKRGVDVRRREFARVRCLAADMNVAPTYTLDTVEDIVRRPQLNIRGLLLTLKLLDWNLADQIPEYLARVRGWGYPYVRARQLQHNRQEICVAALRRKPRPKR